MFSFGLFVFLFGALGLAGTLALNLAAPDAATVSADLMATRGIFVTAASALCIVGAVFMGCGAIRNELRQGRNGSKKVKQGEKREPNLDHLPQRPVAAALTPEPREFGSVAQKPRRNAAAG